MAGDRFTESQALLSRTLELIPLRTQTFSKARYAFPGGDAAHFIDRARGGRLWDVDGNEYVDQNGLRHAHGEESFDHVTDVNLKGTFWCIRAFAGMRRKRGGPGCIVNIGDLNGLTSYVTGQTLAVDGGMTAW